MEANRIEIFLRDFISAWQAAKIYEVKHRLFLDSVEVALGSLKLILKAKKELIVGVVGEELACGEDIFFELSQRQALAIGQLKAKNIERIIFQSGVTKEELTNFIALLVSAQAPAKDNLNDYLRLVGIKNIKVGRIKDLELKQKGKQHLTSDDLSKYEDCLEKVSKSLDSLINEDAVDFLKLKFVASTIRENLFGNYQMFLRLSQVKTYDSTTFIHLLNVSILSIYFSDKLGLASEDCLAIGAAALLHDIGKLFISRKIIRKTGKLEAAEFNKIKSHTVLGAEILLRYSDSLGILPAVVAFEHHLGWDCKGYPKTPFYRRPHLGSSIVHICDEYDALSQRRSYKRDYPPELIYQIMTKQRGSKFSPQLLDRFFKIIGLWPRGTIVRLNDERIAIVREVNEEDIYRPKVEIVSEPGEEIIDLSLTAQIEIRQALNPLTEGKQYLDFI